MKFDSLIFDVDGTLWNAAGTIARGFSAASEEFEFGKKEFSKERVMAEAGRPLNDIFMHLYPELAQKYSGKEMEEKLAKINEVSTKYEYDYLKKHGGDLFPGVVETLQYLSQKMPLYIVSNCEKGYIEIMMESSGIKELFTDWLCYGDTLQEKDVTMKKIIEKHGLKNPAYIGDIKNDALSSQKAGVPFIYAAYGFGEVDSDLYCERIDDFRELKNIIE